MQIDQGLNLVSEPGLRFYSPRLGRWLSRDPMGEGPSANLFFYVNNSPPSFIDDIGAFTIPSIPSWVNIFDMAKLLLGIFLNFDEYQQALMDVGATTVWTWLPNCATGTPVTDLKVETWDALKLKVTYWLPSWIPFVGGFSREKWNFMMHQYVYHKICCCKKKHISTGHTTTFSESMSELNHQQWTASSILYRARYYHYQKRVVRSYDRCEVFGTSAGGGQWYVDGYPSPTPPTL